MSGLYMFTCPICRSVVEYGCNCDEPQPHDRWEGHDSFEAAKARVDEIRAPNPRPSLPHQDKEAA